MHVHPVALFASVEEFPGSGRILFPDLDGVQLALCAKPFGEAECAVACERTDFEYA